MNGSFDLPQFKKYAGGTNNTSGNSYQNMMQKMQMMQAMMPMMMMAKMMGMDPKDMMSDMGINFGGLTSNPSTQSQPSLGLDNVSNTTVSKNYVNNKGIVDDIDATNFRNIENDGQTYNLAARNGKKLETSGALGRKEYEEELKTGWADNFDIADINGEGKGLTDKDKKRLIKEGILTEQGFNKDVIAAKQGKILDGVNNADGSNPQHEFYQKLYDGAEDANAAGINGAKADLATGFSTGNEICDLEGVNPKAISVEKDGKVHFDVSKLSDEEFQKIMDNGGLNYGGSADLVIDNLDKVDGGEKLDLNITGDASTVVLGGSKDGGADIRTDNKSIKIIAGENTSYTVKGENLEHVVAQGGEFEGIEGNTDKLKALKLKDTKMAENLNINSKENLAINLDGVSGGKDVNINQEEGYANKDATIMGANSHVGNINAAGQDVNTTLSGGSAKDVNISATGDDGDVNFRAFKGVNLGNVDIDAKDDANVTLNNANVGNVDLSGVSDQNQVFIGRSAKADNIALNDGGKDKNMVMFENEATKDDMVRNVKDSQGGTTEEFTSQLMNSGNSREVYKQFFDVSDSDYNNLKSNLNSGQGNYEAHGWGPTPGGAGKGGFGQRFLEGFVRAYNNPMSYGMTNNMYGNPYQSMYNQQQYMPQYNYFNGGW